MPSRFLRRARLTRSRSRRRSSRPSTIRPSDDALLGLSLTPASCRFNVDFGIGDYEPLSAASDVDHSSFTSAGLLSSGCASVRSIHSLSVGVNDDRGGNGSSGKISDNNDGNGCGGAKEQIGQMSDGTTVVAVENTALKKIELKLSWAVCENVVV